MGFFNVIKNEVKAAVGYQQNFTALLEAKDISRALNYMQDRSGFAEKALLEYKVENHEVMKRQDKAVYDKKGNFLRWQKRWKIPIPYQSFINEIALVFLYGRPVKWTQRSKGTDYAFEQYIIMKCNTSLVYENELIVLFFLLFFNCPNIILSLFQLLINE